MRSPGKTESHSRIDSIIKANEYLVAHVGHRYPHMMGFLCKSCFAEYQRLIVTNLFSRPGRVCRVVEKPNMFVVEGEIAFRIDSDALSFVVE